MMKHTILFALLTTILATPLSRRCGGLSEFQCEGSLVCTGATESTEGRCTDPWDDYARWGESCGVQWSLPCPPNGKCTDNKCVEVHGKVGDVCKNRAVFGTQCASGLACVKLGDLNKCVALPQ
jgi:hypothetical protein